MLKVVLGLIGLFVGVGAIVLVALQIPAVTDTLAAREIERRVSERRTELFEPDALRVLMCGTGSPFPDPDRAKSCVAVFAAERFWVVDVGPGSANVLSLLGVDGSRIGGVLLTHFHSDHIGDLGELNMITWADGRVLPLRVFGPPGVDRVVAGLNETYALASKYRNAHHGESFMPLATSVMQPEVIDEPKYGEGPTKVVEIAGLTITAFPVRHEPVRPAYGYRFDYLGRSVVISGDTMKTPTLVDAAKGVDVLVHEAEAGHMVEKIGEIALDVERPRVAQIMEDIRSYHTSPVQAAEAANAAGAKLLVLTHLVPPPPNAVAAGIFTRGVDAVRSDGWVLGEDGLLITLPENSEEIELETL
jgi:ribonuclease Z